MHQYSLPGAAFAAMMALAPQNVVADEFDFRCIWNNQGQINITVDPEAGTATRDDGGLPYKVIKVTKWAVFLAVDEPNNVAGLAIQTIQRAEAVQRDGDAQDQTRPGLWTDTVLSVSGNANAISGGQCW